MSEFDELVSRDGVLLAGRVGPDWRVAEYKAVGCIARRVCWRRSPAPCGSGGCTRDDQMAER